MVLFSTIGACYGNFKSIHKEQVLQQNEPQKHAEAATKKKLRSRRQRVSVIAFRNLEGKNTGLFEMTS